MPTAGGDIVGTTLKGQYRVERELGHGAVGVVFQAVHLALGKLVAIKMLRQSDFASPAAQERFQREARTASLLSHPGIAQVFDFGIEDGRPFLVMEFVDGKDLSELLSERGPLPLPAALSVMRQLMAVLQEAHQHGVIHRDIKPGNMKLVRYGSGDRILLKVLDFGLAKQVGQAGDPLTAPGTYVGTPLYMAPEQIGGAIDGRTDLYAAGVSFYEILTGGVPFSGLSVEDILTGHLTRPPPPLPGHVPAGVSAVVVRLLEKQPQARFQDASAADRALEACEEALRAPPPGPASAKSTGLFRERSRAWALLPLILLAGVMALVAYLWR